MRGKVEGSFEIKQPNDFITNIRHDIPTDSLIFIHEQPLIDISHAPQSGLSSSLAFQTNVYDAAMVGAGALLVSNKNMPVRIYKMDAECLVEQGGASIYDKKQNSELFLTPLQVTTQEGRVVGGGKKFLSEYDLTKLCARQCKTMSKRYISSVEMLGKDTVIVGSFEGHLQLLDLSSGQIVSSSKPHMDLVSRIKRVPNSAHLFASLARKDNLSYLWDVRNMDSFLCCFQHPLYGNQRTGLDISPDGRYLHLGGEKGQLFSHSLQHPSSCIETPLGIDKCVGSICCADELTFCAVGERQYPMFGETSSPGYVFSVSAVV